MPDEIEEKPDDVETTEEEKPDLSADDGPTVAEKAEAELDAALASMDVHDDDDEEDKAAAAKAKKKADEDDDDIPEGGEELDVEDDEEEPEASDDDKDEEESEEDDEDVALHRSYTILHEQGVPTSVLKRTPKEQLIAWASRVEASTATKNGAKTPEPDSERDSSDGAKTESEPAQAAIPDWATARKGIAEKLGIDEESADAFKYLHDAQVARQAREDSLMAELKAMRESAMARDGRETIDRNVRRLKERYPQLKRDPDAKTKLLNEAVLLRRGGVNGEKELFDKAALLAFGQPKRSDLAAMKRNGLSHGPTGTKGIKTQAVSEDDYWVKTLDHIDAGRPELARAVAPPRPQRKR